MPDLSLQASRQYWKDYPDPMIYRVVSFMEGVEQWTLDGNPELEAEIDRFGRELDDISKVDFNALGKEALFIRLACNLRMPRTLRLLQAIDTVHPGSASRLLVNAEETSQSMQDPAGIFLRRNIVFERLRLLARVFSEERFKLVLKALEGEEG